VPGRPNEAQLRGEEPYYGRAGQQLSLARVQAIERNWGTTYQKGKVGNPRGRPKGSTILQHIRDLLDKPTRALFDKETLVKANLPAAFLSRKVAHAFAMTILKEAIKGDMNAAKMVMDRMYGTVAQRLAGPDGGPLDGGMTQVQINMLMSDPEAAAAARLVAVKMAELEDAALPALPAPAEDDDDPAK
jgi:hypothetical protein